MSNSIQPIRLEEFVLQETQRLLDFAACWKMRQKKLPHAKAALMPLSHWRDEWESFPKENGALTEEDDFGKFAAVLLAADINQLQERIRQKAQN